MAFCIIEPSHLENLTALAFSRIRKNPEALKSFKTFSQDIFNYLVGKGMAVDRSITMVKYLPQIVSEFRANPDDRALLKKAGVSMDAIDTVEDTFKDYAQLGKYLGIKDESTPIVVVNDKQIAVQKKMSDLAAGTKVEFNGDQRIINGTAYTTRVTSIAKVGFDDNTFIDDDDASPALKHGNTIDAIAKSIFDDENPKQSDFADRIEPAAFDSVVSKLKKLKQDMQEQGYIFKTGLTVYNKKLGLSGEIDLVAINPEGEAYILDFKTANQRFNEPYLKNSSLTFKSDTISHEVGILSKWKQYATQGGIYAKLLNEQLSIPTVNRIGIIGINVVYDSSVPASESKIQNIGDIALPSIPISDMRAEFKDKNIQQIFDEYKTLEGKSLSTVTEIVKKRKPLENTTDLQSLDRVAIEGEAPASESQITKEANWVRSTFGNDVFDRIQEVVDAGILGKWSLAGITLYRNASEGTGYHEGWHQFSQVFMSKKQKEALYNSVQDDAIRFHTREGERLNTKDASYLQVEEFLAEQFAKYAMDPKAYKYPTTNRAPKSIFQKIWDFLKRYFGPKPSPITAFSKLYRGDLAEYKPSVNNAFWGSLNSIAENADDQEIVSNERFPLYAETMDRLVGEALDKAGKSFTAFKQSKILQGKIVNNAFKPLEEKYNDPSITDQQADEIASIFRNKYAFIIAWLRSGTSYDTLKGFMPEESTFTLSNEEIAAMEQLQESYGSEETVGELDGDEKEDYSKAERFERTGNEDAAHTLGDDVVDFFRSISKIKTLNPDGTPVYELNELGFKRNHTYFDVFYRTKRFLSGAFDMDDMLNAIGDKNNQRIFPELSEINDKIRKFTENTTELNPDRIVQNTQFIRSFWFIMSMPEVPNMQLSINALPIEKNYNTFKPTVVSYRIASRNMALKIIRTWEKNFKDKRGKKYSSFSTLDEQNSGFMTSPLYLTADGKMLLNPFANFDELYPTAKVSSVIKFFSDLGFTFNPKVFQDPEAVRYLKGIKSTLTQNIRIYSQAQNLDFILFADDTLITNGVNTGALATVEDYAKALTPTELDAAAKKFFIDNIGATFNERREYDTGVMSKGKLVQGKQTTKSMGFDFEDMAALEEKYGDRVSSGSFRVENKTKHPYYIPNELLLVSRMINDIKKMGDFDNKTYLQHLNPNKNKWMNRSYFFKTLFDHNGERALDINGKPVQLITEDIALVRMVSSELGTSEKHPKSLSPDEKFFADLLTMLGGGALEIPRAESSSSIYSIRLSDYGGGAKTPITLDDTVGMRGLPEKFHAIVKDYFAAEIEKRQWYMKNDRNARAYTKVPLADQFNLFQGILSQDLRTEVEKHLDKTPEDIFLQKDIESRFRAEIETYFNDRINEIRDRIDTPKTGLPVVYKAIIRDAAGMKTAGSLIPIARMFALNQFILANEFYNLYFGDLYFYKNPFKRGKIVSNTGTSYYIDDRGNEMLNKIQFQTLHSVFHGIKAGGKDFKKMKSGIINDVEMKSAYINDNDRDNILLQDTIRARQHAGVPVNEDDMNAIKHGLSKYAKINIADGQGIIGIDFYRNFSIMTKIWSDDKEQEYKRQIAIYRSHNNLYHRLDENGEKVPLPQEERDDMYNKDRALAKTKTSPNGYLNPLKISYTGPQAKDGPFRPVFDKFSVRPILPEAAIGRRDEDMLNRMVEQDIDYLKFQSGTKIYQDNSFDWYKKVADGTYDLNKFEVEEDLKSNELYSAYLKHQLSTEEIKEKSVLGSQFRKIFFGVKYTNLVKNNPEALKFFTDLENQFMGSIKDILSIEQDNLFSTLGIEEKNGTYKVTDMKKFLKLLNDESLKRGIAINNVDYLQYNEATKNAKYPIDYAFNRQQIQDLLSGLIDNSLRRMKVNNTPFIQVSSAGYENNNLNLTGATRAEITKYGTTGLHYYHIIYDKNGKPQRTSRMGVKVGLIGEFKNLLNLPAPESLGSSDTANSEGGMLETGEIVQGKQPKYSTGPLRTIENLNKAMQDPKWKAEHIDKFTLIGYRIPTQNNNFIDHMEIMEFLPESVGSILIPPIELIIKSGSDFDIDKMNVLRYSYEKGNGSIIGRPKESIQEINQAISELTFDEADAKTAKKVVNALLRDKDAEITDYVRIQKKIRLTILRLAMQMSSDAMIDAIQENIQTKGNFVIPKSVPEETAFPDDLEPNTELDLAKAIEEYANLDDKIEALKKTHKAYRAEKERISKEDLVWFTRKSDYRKSLNNDMVKTLSKALSHPSYFEPMITPSTTEMMEGYVNDLIASQEDMTPQQYQDALKKNDNKLFDNLKTPEENSRYTTSLDAFTNLLYKAKDLGGYAIQRTFSDMFNFVNFSISKNYIPDLPENNTINKIIFTPLIAPEDRNKMIKNGRIKMHGESASGIPIKDSFDQLISLTVDLANSLAYPKMGINTYNRRHFQYLLHQGVDPKVAIWFLNQPILQTVYDLADEKKRKIGKYSLKHAIVETALSQRVLENPNLENSKQLKYRIMASEWVDYDMIKAEEEGKKGEEVINEKQANPFLSRPYMDINEQNLKENDYFSLSDMDEAIRNNTKRSPLQSKVLAYFGSIIDEVDKFSAVQFANNVDTTKYSTLSSLNRNKDNKMNIRRSGLFDNKQLDKLEKESMIAPFDYTKKAYEIQKALFPKLYTNTTIRTFRDLLNDVSAADNVELERISKIIENDFIESVYKNFSSYEGMNLSDHFQALLTNTDGTQNHDFFTYRFLDIKNDFPELESIPFISALYEDVYTPPVNPIENSYEDLDNMEIRNLFLLRNPNNPTFEKNVFTSNWRNLINFSPEKLGLQKVYTPEETRRISEFFNDMIYFSLYQSGLTNTGNGFSDLIPYEYWAAFIQSSFDEMAYQMDLNNALEDEFMKVFQIRFKQMNPKVNWRKKYVQVQEFNNKGKAKRKEIDFFKNYYRGKDYKVTDDDLNLVRNTILYDEDDLADDNPNTPAAPRPTFAFPLEVGRYVKYNDGIYMVTKNLRKGVWQIYNPTKEGAAAKLGVSEKNLTTLKDVGRVVQYGQKEYIVTAKKEIIDLENNKIVRWGSTDRNRIAILKLAENRLDDGTSNSNTDYTVTGINGLNPITPDC